MDRRIGQVAAFVVVMALMVFPATVGLGQAGSDREAILFCMSQLETSYLEEDMDLFSSLVSDAGFVMVMPAPGDAAEALVLDKEATLRPIGKQWERTDHIEHRHIEPKIDVHGPIATSVSTIRDRTRAGQTSETKIFHIWAKEDGRWRLVFTSPLLALDR
jgi:hypothetical protein